MNKSVIVDDETHMMISRLSLLMSKKMYEVVRDALKMYEEEYDNSTKEDA